MTLGPLRRFDSTSAFLLVTATLACFVSQPGRVPGDTKLYLYLDPARLVSDSIWSWDWRMFGGWVPHQNVGYLWPTGPFYWVLDFIGLPDWISQRIWISVLLVAAGIGTVRLCRHLGIEKWGALLAATFYQFSPYVLPYVSRTSALLIPWSLLPWLILISLRYASHRRIRDLAIFALLVASTGGLNATALLMIAPAPVLWIFHLLRKRQLTRTQFLSVVSHLAFVSVLASAWWLSGLIIQGRYGAAVLSYSEALQSTSATSTTPEVLRGLGYWLFYDRGPIFPLTTASRPYQGSIPVLVLGSCSVLIGLFGILRSKTWRWPLAAMLFVGVVLSVGAHPFGDPSLIFQPLVENSKSALSLALRSSTRAAPLVVLALALGIGFLSSRLTFPDWAIRIRAPYLLAGLLLVAQQPGIMSGHLIDPHLTRPERLPGAWTDAAAYLDDRYDDGYRGSVLMIPGIESAAFDWGYPVDAVLPGLSRKPLLTRDWLPLGSPALMDLLYALDDSFQNGTADPRSIAPVARLLGADTVMFVSSFQFDRFGTVRPSRSIDVFEPMPPGLSHLATFGDTKLNEPLSISWSEEIQAFPDRPLPEITLYSVDEVSSPARLHSDAVPVSVDGSGLVDLAASGLITGSELLISSSSLDETSLQSIVDRSPFVVITDSNRRRAHHWRGSQDVWGATEPVEGVVTEIDDFDSRLPIDSRSVPDSQTLVEHSPVSARASAYGMELRYQPEYRPRMSIDGDLSTAWRLGPDRSPVGELLSLESSNGLSDLRLLQPLDPGAQQWITEISVRVDHGPWKHVQLTDESRVIPGQKVALPDGTTSADIRIEGVNRDERYLTSLGVGFAEVLDGESFPEVVELPSRLRIADGKSIVYSLNRLRSDSLDRWRDDPESSLLRRLPVLVSDISRIDLEVRLSTRASDVTLLNALGIDSVPSDFRLHGSAIWWGPSAFDGDESTAWRGPVSVDTRTSGFGSFTVPLTGPASWIELVQPNGDEWSLATRLRLEFRRDGIVVDSRTVDLPSPDQDGRSKVTFPTQLADDVVLTILDVDAEPLIDMYTGRTIEPPVSLKEVFSDGWVISDLSRTFDTGCRSDLVFLDSIPIPVRLNGSVSDALSGRPVTADVCGPLPDRITSGALLRTVPGVESGWDIDRISIAAADRVTSEMAVLPLHRSRIGVSATVPACRTSCWLELPIGYSPGWSATIDGRSSSGMRSAAGTSIWPLGSSVNERTFTARWTPQMWMWIGLVISGLTVLVALVLTVRRRTVPAWSQDPEIETRGASAALETTSWKSAYRRIGLILAIGALVVTPVWGLVSATAVGLLWRKRSWIAPLTVIAIGAGFLFVVLQQVRTGAQPSFGWPSTFERSHRPMLAALIVYVSTADFSTSSFPALPLRSRNKV